MSTKSTRFQFDWYLIPKRAVYLAGFGLVLLVLALGFSAYVRSYGYPWDNMVAETNGPSGAHFISLDGEVRVIRAQTRQTHVALQEMPLYPGDVVQTQADGRARIQLADGSTLAVRPNSVITIRDSSGIGLGEKPNVRVAVDRGQINVKTQQLPVGATNVVETRQTHNQLAPQTGASFGVRDDDTEDIRISTGSMETSTRGGENTTVRAGEYLFVNQAGQVARRERLLNAPQTISPKDLENIFVQASGKAGATLRWQQIVPNFPGAYRVEVATSPFFVAAGKVVERGHLAGEELTVGELRPGVYFWRVRAEGQTGQLSEWSEPQKFFVSQREGNRSVSASDFSVEYVAGTVYLVRGKTQPGNTVHSGNRLATASSDGSFQMQVAIPRGVREIYLETEDPQGKRARYRVPITASVLRQEQ